MQFILADAANIRVTRTAYLSSSGAGTSYSFHLKVNRIDARDDHQIPVLPGGGKTSTLSVSLYPHHGDTIVCSEEEENGLNLLKDLHDRFQKKIRISLEISAASEDDAYANEEGGSSEIKLCIPSKTGMIINSDGSCSSFGSSFIDDFHRMNLEHALSFSVKLIAHITCDHGVFEASPAEQTSKRILEEAVASDVVIEAANGDEIRSHKCFLISSSPVLKDKLDLSRNARLDMTDLSKEGIMAFLRFIYFGVVIGPEQEIDTAYSLLYAAIKYDVPKLAALMTNYIVEREDEDFSPIMALKVYKLVKGIAIDSRVSAKMIGIISKNFKGLKKLPEFKENVDDALEICDTVVNSLKRKLEEHKDEAVKQPRPSCSGALPRDQGVKIEPENYETESDDG